MNRITGDRRKCNGVSWTKVEKIPSNNKVPHMYDQKKKKDEVVTARKFN